MLVFEKGHAPNVHVLFETASEKYAWLNSAVAYASGGPFEGGVALDVWQVSCSWARAWRLLFWGVRGLMVSSLVLEPES